MWFVRVGLVAVVVVMGWIALAMHSIDGLVWLVACGIVQSEEV